MNTQKRKSTRLARLGRALKLNFVKLLRAPGGAHKVSIGFALGFGLELIVISTASLIYLAFYPIIRLSGGSLPAAIVGNVIGKLTFLPILLMPLAKQIGSWILPAHGMGQGALHENAFMELFRGNWFALKELLLGGAGHFGRHVRLRGVIGICFLLRSEDIVCTGAQTAP